MKASIRLLKKQGYSAPKQLLRILLLALSPAEVAMASSPVPMDDVSAVASLTSPAWNFMDMKNASFASLLTLLCGAVAVCFYLRYALGKARGENFARKMDKTFHQILDELEYKMAWGMWGERNAETLEQKRRRYLDSEMCECSDDEYWRSIHYGPPWTDSPGEPEGSEESSLSNDTMLRCSNLSPELRQIMIETNDLLRTGVGWSVNGMKRNCAMMHWRWISLRTRS